MYLQSGKNPQPYMLAINAAISSGVIILFGFDKSDLVYDALGIISATVIIWVL